MSGRRGLFVLALCFLCLGVMSQGLAAEQDIYVAEYGNDGNAGTMDAPLQSITEAMYRLSQRPAGTTFTNIWLFEGTYALNETLFVEAGICYNAAIRGMEGETAIITGAPLVENWVETTLLDRTVWVAPYFGTQLHILYGEEGVRPVSRWPKDGSMLQAQGPAATGEDKFDQQDAFYVNAAEVPASLNGAYLRLLHWWKDELSGVRQYQPGTGLVTLNRPMSMAVEKGDLYWFENVITVPLSDGEWVLDAVNHMLYYAPLPGEVMGETRLYAGAVEQLINITGAKNTTFENITFARTGWNIPRYDMYADFPQAAYDANAAVYISYSEEIYFRDCVFREIGAGGIRFDHGVKDAEVIDCAFTNMGAHAVYVHGKNIPGDPYTTERIAIENNHIHGYGKNFLNATAVLIIHARNIEIAHNEIHDGTYTAVSAGWVWGSDFNITNNVTVRNNWIYDIGQGYLSDMGAIYMLGSQPNSHIYGNIIHDVISADYGGWGIYLDEGSSGIQVMNNLVYRCSAQGFHQHEGSGNLVVNNVFAFNMDRQVASSGKSVFTLDRNVIVGSKPYLMRNDGGSINEGSNFFSEDSGVFVDASQQNFSLAPNAGLDEIGFVPWVYMAGRYYE